MSKNLVNSIYLAVGITAFSYAIGLLFGWVQVSYIFSWMGFLEFFAVLTSYSCTILFAWQRRHAYTTGVVTTAAYSLLFWLTGAHSLAIFNLYLVFSLAYGWFRWGPDKDTRPVTTIQGYWWFGYLALGVAIFGILYGVNFLVDGTTFATLNWIDTGLAVASGVAQFGLDNKKIENWILWAIIDIISIPYFLHLGLTIVAFQYIFFLANTIYAWWDWKQNPNGVVTNV